MSKKKAGPTGKINPFSTKIADLVRKGRIPEAVAACDQAVRSGGDDIALLQQVNGLYMEVGRNAEAYAVGQRLVRRLPDDIDTRINQGLVCMRVNRYGEALDHFLPVLNAEPANLAVRNNLATVYFGMGFIEDALAQLKAATELAPDFLPNWQNYLSLLNYDENVGLDELFATHRHVGERVLAAIGPRPAVYANDPAPRRRLRIGYLSGDFMHHPASHYIAPVLQCHDPAAVEIYAYSLSNQSDLVTDFLKRLVPNWRQVADLGDEALFQLIQQDRIDILVDLSGHTARGRITVTARKPAPVMVNWIGYLNTLGIPGIDWALLDRHLLSPEAAAGFVEKPYHLPDIAYCYAPLIDPRPLPPPPFQRNGSITFGCYNNPAKVSRKAVAVWSDILRAEPGSTILFKYKTFDEPMVKARVLEWFAGHGIAADRVRFDGYSPLGAFIDAFSAIDIALDSFPYTGVTTTMHTLWSGVPVVTLEGATPMQRFGRTALECIGRPDWVARSPAEYVEVTRRLVAEVKANEGLRQDVKRRMLQSAMMRHPAFVRQLEAAYRDMWEQWCAAHGSR